MFIHLSPLEAALKEVQVLWNSYELGYPDLPKPKNIYIYIPPIPAIKHVSTSANNLNHKHGSGAHCEPQ